MFLLLFWNIFFMLLQNQSIWHYNLILILVLRSWIIEWIFSWQGVRFENSGERSWKCNEETEEALTMMYELTAYKYWNARGGIESTLLIPWYFCFCKTRFRQTWKIKENLEKSFLRFFRESRGRFWKTLTIRENWGNFFFLSTISFFSVACHFFCVSCFGSSI